VQIHGEAQARGYSRQPEPARRPEPARALPRTPHSHLLDPQLWPAVLATITCYGVMFSSLIVLPARLAAAPYRLNEAQIGAANGGPGAGEERAGRARLSLIAAPWLPCCARP
jgi:hypothetical protein